MAARTTMASLITLVRGLINDPTGVSAVFTDDQIQAELDLSRAYHQLDALVAYPAVDGSQIKWQSPNKYWESDLVITDPAGTVLTPATSDPNSGYFTLAESQSGIDATGFTYDIYAASAVLLIRWAGRIEQDLTKFSADGSSYEFSGVINSKLKLAAEYEAKSTQYGGIRSIEMVRNDLNFI